MRIRRPDDDSEAGGQAGVRLAVARDQGVDGLEERVPRRRLPGAHALFLRRRVRVDPQRSRQRDASAVDAAVALQGRRHGDTVLHGPVEQRLDPAVVEARGERREGRLEVAVAGRPRRDPPPRPIRDGARGRVVEDLEARLHARLEREAAQEPLAERVDRLDLEAARRLERAREQRPRPPQALRSWARRIGVERRERAGERRVRRHGPVAQRLEEARLHLVGRRLGVGEAEHPIGRRAGEQQAHHAIDQHARFARARIGRDEHVELRRGREALTARRVGGGVVLLRTHVDFSDNGEKPFSPPPAGLSEPHISRGEEGALPPPLEGNVTLDIPRSG